MGSIQQNQEAPGAIWEIGDHRPCKFSVGGGAGGRFHKGGVSCGCGVAF